MPWPYHKYVGHDINRDTFMLNMAESRTLARLLLARMASAGVPRHAPDGQRTARAIFVPPNDDPIDPNQDPLDLARGGAAGRRDGAGAREPGTRPASSRNAMYDYYWPGYEDSAPLGRNTVCLLTEAASARLASPIEIAAKDLRGSRRAAWRSNAPQINFPNPWPGGTWRLRDIVDYNLVAMRGLLGAAARYRDEIAR